MLLCPSVMRQCIVGSAADTSLDTAPPRRSPLSAVPASACRSWPVGFDAAGPPLVPGRRVAGPLPALAGASATGLALAAAAESPGGTVEAGVDATGVGGVKSRVDGGAEAAGDGGFTAEAGAIAESVAGPGRPA